MTKFQCLKCDHLDIEMSAKAVCTGSYMPIENSLYGIDCPHFRSQEQ